MNTNIHLLDLAKESLHGKWKFAVITFAVYILVWVIPQNFEGIGTILSLVFSGPFALGVAIWSLSMSRNNEASTNQIFEGFKNFNTTFTAYLLILFHVVIRLFLLIVPGIVAALSYAMTFYIIADNPDMGAREAMDKSRDMMAGQKEQLFYLCLRFLGLALLCVLTLGIGFLWLMPYANVTMAKFYDGIKEN